MGGRSSSFKSKGSSKGSNTSYVKARLSAKKAAIKAFDGGKDINTKFGDVTVKRVSRNRILIKGRGRTSTIIPDYSLQTGNGTANEHFGKGIWIEGHMSEQDVKDLMPKCMYKI